VPIQWRFARSSPDDRHARRAPRHAPRRPLHISGVKRYHHRDVGDLQLNPERLEVVFDTGLTIVAYTADPGTRSAEALRPLGSLAATPTAERPTPAR
jgi:hypothetical protein